MSYSFITLLELLSKCLAIMWPVNSILDRTDLEGEVLEDRPRDLNVVLVLPLTNLVTLGSSLFLSFGVHFLHV